MKKYCPNQKHAPYEIEVNAGDIEISDQCPYCRKYLVHKAEIRKTSKKSHSMNDENAVQKMTYSEEGLSEENVQDITVQKNDKVDNTGSGSYGRVHRNNSLTSNRISDKAEQENNNVERLQRPVNSVSKSTKVKKNTERKIEIIVSDCFDKYDVKGMSNIKSELNQMYHCFNNESIKEMHGKGAIIDTTIKSQHFFIAGDYGCGKSLLTYVLAKLIGDLSIRAEEPKTLKLNEFKDVINNNKAEDIENFFKDCDDKIVIFDGNLEEIFTASDGEIELNYESRRAIRDIMKEYAGKFTIIFNGSKKCAETFFSQDEKVKKICKRLTIENYTPDDAVEIVNKIIQVDGYCLEKEAYRHVYDRLNRTYFDEHYSLGKFVDDLYEVAKDRLSVRMQDMTNMGRNPSFDDRVTFILSDVQESVFDEEKLEELLVKLESMTGLNAVKENIRNKVEQVRMNKRRMDNGEKPTDFGFMNMLFVGEPGTGKSLVVDIVAEMYFCMGLLRKNEVIKVSKQNMTNSFQNGSSQKTQEYINKALGGILFIDEAYSLMNSGKENAREVIDVLVDQTSRHERDLLVIMAGYENEIDELMTLNEGMPSRFPESNRVRFENYSLEEMTKIFYQMAEKQDVSIETNCEQYVAAILKEKSRDKKFGNARCVKTTLTQLNVIASKRQNEQIKKHGRCQEGIIKSDFMQMMGNTESVEDVLQEINEMIGLHGVKKEIDGLMELVKYQQDNEQLGIEAEPIALHLVFSGAPGTGKTTVARKLGKIYKSLGLLSKGHVIEVKRKHLVGKYVGETALKTEAVINKAQGGILFIDEAYMLAGKGENDYGPEAIGTLLTAMEDNRDNFMVIVAGYEKEMEEFVKSDPGLKSRFTQIIRFENYSVEEMCMIFESFCCKGKYTCAPETKDVLWNYFNSIDIGEKGNAREVRNLYEQTKKTLAKRVNKADTSVNRLLILAEDVENAIKLCENERCDICTDFQQMKGNADTVESVLKEINEMIGLSGVKREINELMKVVELRKKRVAQGKRTAPRSLHLVFSGGPGTGKTTVARELGRIYKCLGLLSKGHVIEADREMLVGKHVGETAPRTKEVINKAFGGILFIDEAYMLADKGENDFGQEVIDTLLKLMEDNREEFMVIVAGYDEKMKSFIKSNDGLASRFKKTIYFEDYSAEEMCMIFNAFCSKEDYICEPETTSILIDYFNSIDIGAPENANARGARKLFEQTEISMAERIAKEDDEVDLSLILAEDVENAVKAMREAR